MRAKKPTTKAIQAPPMSEVALAKLQLSGLDLNDAKRLKIEVLSGTQTSALGYLNLPSLKLNYYTPDGKPMSDWPKAKPFYRLRYLAVPNDFSKQTDQKPLRYTQPPDTTCCAYFPLGVDWKDILADHNQALVITEGELKAACACKQGFSTIGLGGVYNWRALLKGIELLPELKAINWVHRNVYICFDSDYMTNPMVCAALRELGDVLVNEGAYIYVATLPSVVKDQKTGLDDFLISDEGHTFGQLLHAAPALGLTKHLFAFNEKYIYVNDPGLVVDQQTFMKVSPGAFKDHLEATKRFQEKQLKPDGSISYKEVSGAGSWLTWPLRKQALKLTYQPGQPRLMEAPVLLNTWPGWGVQPKKGDVKPFLQLLDHLFEGAEPEAKEWFLRWCAYPIQHPGTKMFSSVVIHGLRNGTGKSLVGYTLGRIYGKNFSEITQADLHGSFNEWAEAKQLIMGDDVTGGNKRQDADMLKKLITQKEMRVNAKYIPSYTIPDCLNYLFTSNHPDAFFLEDDDRRFFIHEVLVGPLEPKFYRHYAGVPGKPDTGWLGHGGAEAVFDFLLNLNLGDFDAAGHAFKTQARARMITDIQSDLGSWVRQLLATPDQLLVLGDIPIEKDLLTSKELLLLYDPIGKTGTTAGGLGRELRRAGCQQVCKGMPIRLADGSQVRPYAIRNAARWLMATPKACEVHMDVEADNQKPQSKKAKF